MNFNANGVAPSFETGRRIGPYDGNLYVGALLNVRRILIKCLSGTAMVGHPVNGLTGVQEASSFQLSAGETIELFVTGFVKVKVEAGSTVAYLVERFTPYSYNPV